MINQYTIHLDFNSYPRFTHSIGYSNCKLRKRITNLREKIAQLDIMIKNTFLKNSLFFGWKYTHHFRAQAFICYDQNFTQHKFILSHMQTSQYTIATCKTIQICTIKQMCCHFISILQNSKLSHYAEKPVLCTFDGMLNVTCCQAFAFTIDPIWIP